MQSYQKWQPKLCVLLSLMLLPFSITAQQQRELTVFAAASLTDVFTELAAQFEVENAGVKIIFSFGASSALAAQLMEGAPADLFASANQRQIQLVAEANLLAGTPKVFATNRLVIIAPKDNPAQIQSVADLAKPNLKLILAADGVPIREYTNVMLEKLSALPDYGEAYRRAVLANLVSEEANVRQVAAKVALGEADVAVVYASDVTPDLAESVISVEVPDAVNTLAEYPIAVLQNAAAPNLARSFAEFVLSEDGQIILAKWGFLPPPDPEETDPAATAAPIATPKR